MRRPQHGNRADRNGTRGRLLIGATALGFLLPVALYFWFIRAYSIDMLHADQWFDIRLIQQSSTGTLRFGALWAQHGANRIFFQNLITLIVAHLARYNVLVEVYLDALLLVGAVTLVFLTHHRRSRSIPWFAYCPAVIVLLSVAQWYGALYGFSLGWYLIMFTLAIALFFLDRPTLTGIAFCAAVSAAVVGSYSSIQGLFIWPVGLVLLLQRARARSFVVGWVIVGMTTIGIYFHNWNAPGNGVSYSLHHLGETLKFFFFAVGDIVAVPLSNAPHGMQYGIFLLGVVIVAVGIWSILLCGLRVDASSARPVGMALICFGLLFAAAAAGARTSSGLSGASYSIYVLFDVLILVGSYLVMLDPSGASAWSSARGRRRWQGTTIALVALMALQVILGTGHGISSARGYRDYEMTGAVVTANIQRASDGLVENELGSGYESADFIRQMIAYAKRNRLSLFSTAEIASYAKQGLPVNRTPPTTGVVKPTNGSSLHGSIYLVAWATDPAGVTRVQFVLREKDGRSTIISQGVATRFGWIGAWDTRMVPNGEYTIRSTAYATGGLIGSSSVVSVTIAN